MTPLGWLGRKTSTQTKSVTLTSMSFMWVGKVKHRPSEQYLTSGQVRTTSIKKLRRYSLLKTLTKNFNQCWRRHWRHGNYYSSYQELWYTNLHRQTASQIISISCSGFTKDCSSSYILLPWRPRSSWCPKENLTLLRPVSESGVSCEMHHICIKSPPVSNLVPEGKRYIIQPLKASHNSSSQYCKSDNLHEINNASFFEKIKKNVGRQMTDAGLSMPIL